MNSRLDGSRDRAGRGASQFLGKVYNGGSMPRGREAVYLVHPVQLAGKEAEGEVADIQVDTSRSIPVVVIGSRQPVIGDLIIAHSEGGRWIAESGASIPNCQPSTRYCPGLKYAVNGTVNDPINGTQPIVYDFVKGAWYSGWLPYNTPYALQTGPGQNPCIVGSGISYYFHMLTFSSPLSTQLAASLFLPGQSCRDNYGQPTNAFFGYPGSSYPGLLGKPATTLVQGFTIPSFGDTSSCDPLILQVNWPGNSNPTSGPTASQLPFSSATFTIPKFTPPSYGFTCTTPCPLPKKDLIISWFNVGGNGSGTLIWNAGTNDWTMACANGLSIRLSATGSFTYGFTVTLRGNADCTGSTNVFPYPSQIGQASYICDPLYLSFNVLFTSSLLYTTGYRSFTVTE